MSKGKTPVAKNSGETRIKDLAITGPDAEIQDVTDGRRFLYYFDEAQSDLTEVLRAGTFRFSLKFGRRPTLVLLSSGYGLKPEASLVGLHVISLDEVPPGHFWFGPKPQYYQLPLDL